MGNPILQTIRNTLGQGSAPETSPEVERRMAEVAEVFPEISSIVPAGNIDPEWCFKVELKNGKRFLVWTNLAKLSGVASKDETHLFSDFEASRSLRHPNILTPLHMTQAGEYAVVITEYFEGQLLAGMSKNRKQPRETVLKIFEEITNAVKVAHASGVMHRALCPANILIDDELNIRIFGFGLANVFFDRWLAILHSRKRSDIDYIAPEILNSGLIATVPHCDGFSIGRIIYELHMGQPPKNTIVVLPSKVCKVQHYIDDALLTAMHGDPLRRPQTIENLRERYFGLWTRDFGHLKPGAGPEKQKKGKRNIMGRFRWMRKYVFRFGLFLAVMLSVGGGMVLWEKYRDNPILVSLAGDIPVEDLLERWRKMSTRELRGLSERNNDQFKSLVDSAYQILVNREDFEEAHQFLGKMKEIKLEDFNEHLELLTNNVEEYRKMMELAKAARMQGDPVAEETALARAIELYPNSETVSALQRQNPSRIALQLSSALKELEAKNPGQREWHYHLEITLKRVRLDLSGHPNLVDISPLHGQEIHELDLSGTGISDIIDLIGLPIDELRLDRTRVSDLHAVIGLPLHVLTFRDTPVTDLAAVKRVDSLRCLLGQDAKGPVIEIHPPVPGQQTWINDKGYKFRALPGTTVLMAEREYPDRNGKGPLTSLSFREAENLCSHLTMRERKDNRIASNHRYRLPTDGEWSIAAQLPESPFLSPKGCMLQRISNSDFLNYRKAHTILEFNAGGTEDNQPLNGFFGMKNDIGEWVDNGVEQEDGSCLVRGIFGGGDLDKLRLRATESSDKPVSMIGFRPVLETEANGTKWNALNLLDPRQMAHFSLDSWNTPHLSAAAQSSLLVKTLLNSDPYRAAYISSPYHERDPLTNRLYLRVDLPVSWKDAQLIARQLDGRLAVAENREHLEWLHERFARRQPLGTPLWMGASANSDHNDWSWSSGEKIPEDLWPLAVDIDQKRAALLISSNEIPYAMSATPVNERHSFLVEWEAPQKNKVTSISGE